MINKTTGRRDTILTLIEQETDDLLPANSVDACEVVFRLDELATQVSTVFYAACRCDHNEEKGNENS